MSNYCLMLLPGWGGPCGHYTGNRWHRLRDSKSWYQSSPEGPPVLDPQAMPAVTNVQPTRGCAFPLKTPQKEYQSSSDDKRIANC